MLANNLYKRLATIKIDWFLVTLFGAVALSFIFPKIGADGSPFYLEHFARWGVFVIFFLHGAKLSIAQIKSGLSALKLHFAAQAIVFVIFPIVGATLYFASEALLTQSQRLGIIFLCSISSTISSSIVLTSMAGGNTAGTIFSATISGIIGIFITPLIMAIFYAHSGQIDALGSILEIMKLLLLPFLIGQILRPKIGKFLERHKNLVANLDRSIIVLIVFVAFCNSNEARIFSSITTSSLVIIGLIVIALLFAILSIANSISKFFKLSREDGISVAFVGATKSLANGIPIASVLFANDPNIGIIILPLMLYHPLQLAVCAWLARRWGAAIASR